eukprot:GHUV01053221.1.p1 GENE.GHUV01053221.1~~GHUV01053221.1.p1  ORF type:complete len:114 (+),score=36.27 GHUV01053221.1:589-930(+)
MWTTLVDPQQLAKTAAALEYQLKAQSLPAGYNKKDSSGQGLRQQDSEDSVFVTQSSGCRAEGVHKGSQSQNRKGLLQHAGRPSRRSVEPGANGGNKHLHAVTDEWKMDLLQVC